MCFHKYIIYVNKIKWQQMLSFLPQKKDTNVTKVLFISYLTYELKAMAC